jgi:hypothetical protein
MPFAFVLYPTPLDARATLTPDGAPAITAVPYTDPAGRPGQIAYVPDAVTSDHGAELRLEAPNYESLRVRGFLRLEHTDTDDVARLQVDDYTLTAAAIEPAPGPTPPAGPRTPLDIINGVFAATQPNLATIAGCGKFTEDCCDALHAEHSPMWGHIAKEPGQNQYNGHAVDALMLLANVSNASGGTTAGVYDIIFSSASFEAKPVFNYAHPPQYELWYYPASAPTRGVLMVAVPRFDRR